ncbi:MAG: DUF502 domain-containing protein [Pseudomonadota bacterium]
MPHRKRRHPRAGEAQGLSKLTRATAPPRFRLGARLRNYFFTGLIIVGPITITIYIVYWAITVVDEWIKPLLPTAYNPDTYLPFDVPGLGLFVAIAGLIIIGALAANLLGRTLISSGELMLARMPIVRNVYGALKQIFESVLTAADAGQAFQKVGMVEFPSKGIWSIVFVTADAAEELRAQRPPEDELTTVFMPTAIVPPTGFICFVPRRDIVFLNMSVEDAAKIILSAGMVTPDYKAQLGTIAAAARARGDSSADAPGPGGAHANGSADGGAATGGDRAHAPGDANAAPSEQGGERTGERPLPPVRPVSHRGASQNS